MESLKPNLFLIDFKNEATYSSLIHLSWFASHHGKFDFIQCHRSHTFKCKLGNSFKSLNVVIISYKLQTFKYKVDIIVKV